MSATFRRNLVGRLQTDSCVTILLKSVHSWTQCSDRRARAMSKTEQVMGVEWMNRHEDRGRCKAGDWQKQAAGFISWDLIPASSHCRGLSLHLSEELSVKGLLKPDSFSLSTLLENTGGGGESTERCHNVFEMRMSGQMCCREVSRHHCSVFSCHSDNFSNNEALSLLNLRRKRLIMLKYVIGKTTYQVVTYGTSS